MFLGLLPASMFVPSEGYKFALHTEPINFYYTYIKYRKNNTETQQELQTVAESSVIKVTRILSAMF